MRTYVDTSDSIGPMDGQDFAQLLAAHPGTLKFEETRTFLKVRARLANYITRKHKGAWELGSRKRALILTLSSKADPCACGNPSCGA